MFKTLGRGVMARFFTPVRNFLPGEAGVSMAEYALLLVLIAMVVLVAATVLGTKISSFFESVATTI